MLLKARLSVEFCSITNKEYSMEKTKFVGVDCHKNTIACYVNGKFKEFKTDFKGFKKALQWAGNDCAWALEGAYSYGLTFSTFLLESGCKVYEFNALATAKARKALSICGQKNDWGDAKVISIFAPQANLQEVSTKTVKLKQIITKRKLLVNQRTQISNNLKSSFNQLGIVPPFKNFSTIKAYKWFQNHDDVCIKNFGKLLQTLNESIKSFDMEIETLIPQQTKKLTAITGISTLTAGTIYTEIKGKKMSKAQFASYCGVAPVDCSSGMTDKHRNNHRGNRILNSILYSIAIQQTRFDIIGREYYLKKLQEGKAKKVARKHLQRQLSNLIWKTLFSD